MFQSLVTRIAVLTIFPTGPVLPAQDSMTTMAVRAIFKCSKD